MITCRKCFFVSKAAVRSSAVVGNFVVEYMIAFLGIKQTFAAAAAIYICSSLLFTWTPSFWLLLIAAFLIGFHDQCTMMNAIKAIKGYTIDPAATKYVSWAMTGYACGPFLWPFLITLVVNPGNERKTDIFNEFGVQIAYFSERIVGNFIYFMILQVICYAAVIVPLVLLFESPPGLNGVVWKYLKHTVRGEMKDAQSLFKQSVRLVQEDFDKVVGHTLNHPSGIFSRPAHPKDSLSRKQSVIEDNLLLQRIQIVRSENQKFRGSSNAALQKLSFVGSKNKKMEVVQEMEAIEEGRDSKMEAGQPSLGAVAKSSSRLVLERQKSKQKLEGSFAQSDPKLEELIVEEDSNYEEESLEDRVIREEMWRDMLSLNFLLIILLGIVRTSTSRFYLSYFKLLGLSYFDDDSLVNKIGSLSYLFYIVQGFTYPRTLELLGVRGCYLLIFVSFILFHLLYAVNPESLTMYIALTFVHRFLQGMIRMVGLSTMFVAYGEIKGFRMFKYMDTHCILALVLVSVTVALFPDNYVAVLVFYAFLNAGGIGLLVLWRPNQQ